MALVGIAPSVAVLLVAVALLYWTSGRGRRPEPSRPEPGGRAGAGGSAPEPGNAGLGGPTRVNGSAWDDDLSDSKWSPSEVARFQAMADDVRKRWPVESLPFTPLLTCEPAASNLMERFDWRIVPESSFRSQKPCNSLDGQPWADDARHEDPRTVWAAPHAIGRLLHLAKTRLRPGADRVLVLSGTEMPLSRALGHSEAERKATVLELRRHFGRVLYQTKDVDVDGILLAPMGLSWGYFLNVLRQWCLRDPTTENILRSVVGFGLTLLVNTSVKTHGILASHSWVAKWLDKNNTPGTLTHYGRQGVLVPPSNSSIRACWAAYQSRLSMRLFAESDAGKAAGVELRAMDPETWWRELPKYRFLLSPLGSGIQTAKSVEALMVLTIPIVQRMRFAAFDELVAMGFPLVLVAGWVEVTAANASRWWQALSPRLESFRRNCLTVDGYWRMYTGQVRVCT